MALLVKDENGLLCYPEDLDKVPLDLPPLSQRLAEAFQRVCEAEKPRRKGKSK